MADERDNSQYSDEFVGSKVDKELLAEIREKFTYYTNAWADIRREAATDVQYSLGNPWSEKDKKARDDAGRPALSMDELSQYLNQAINNLRQNQIAIKVSPEGNGANDQTARTNQGLIRGIEYDCSAEELSYVPAFENQITRSYGFWRVTREYVGDGFDQVIKIKGIKNPDSVLYDPDVKEADWSDATGCFVVEPMRKAEFKRRFPKAKVRDFGREEMMAAPEWITDDGVMVAEYWRIEYDTKTITDPNDEKRKRKVQKRKVVKYVTNGIEILETSPQPGTYIPIVPVIGKEVYATEGGRTKRHLLSLIRLARDPYMLYCYLVSQEAEEAAQTPKAPIMGYVGQFETDKVAINEISKVPHSYIQFDPVVDGANGQVLPLPVRPQFQPNFQAYEMAMEGKRRAIQAAMGINPLPTQAQRQNEKSGVALERIQTQTAVGSYHFTANFKRSLDLTGRIILQWIPVVYNTEREAGIVENDGTRKVVTLNQKSENEEESYQVVDEDGDPIGNHTVTISTGPSFDSEREQADDFLDKIISNLQNLPVAPPVKAKLLSLAVKARDLGVWGDEIADLLSPPPDKGQDPQAMVQQMQGQLQQAQQLLQQQHEIISKDAIKAQTDLQKQSMIEQSRLKIADMDNAARILVAQIGAKTQDTLARRAETQEVWANLHDAAHETALQTQAQGHQADMQQQSQQHATEQQQSQQEADQQAQQMQAQQAQPAASGQPE